MSLLDFRSGAGDDVFTSAMSTLRMAATISKRVSGCDGNATRFDLPVVLLFSVAPFGRDSPTRLGLTPPRTVGRFAEPSGSSETRN